MNIIEYRNIFREVLSSKFKANEIDFIYKRLLSSFFEFDSTIIGLNPNIKFSSLQKKKMKNALSLIQNNCPLQYVTGKASFLDFELFVSPDVLIPRPETEELTNWVLKSCRNGQKVYDLCTGSGCIALGIKKNNPTLNVTGIDISEKAILIAIKNSIKLQVDVNWIVNDVKKIGSEHSYIDLIVSNPPYVYPDEKKNMHSRVLDYEPHIALFTPINNPVYYYKYCISFAKKNLRYGGKLFFEVNPNYINDIETLLLNSSFSNINVRKDIFGNKRMLSADKNG